jgi:hypothetical protein
LVHASLCPRATPNNIPALSHLQSGPASFMTLVMAAQALHDQKEVRIKQEAPLQMAPHSSELMSVQSMSQASSAVGNG